MANRKFDFLQCIGRNQRAVHGSFAPNGNSALVAADTETQGCTVAYVSAGKYAVTLLNGYAGKGTLIAMRQTVTPDATLLQTDYDPATGVANIYNWLIGTGLADIAANAKNRISFWFVFDDRLQA